MIPHPGEASGCPGVRASPWPLGPGAGILLTRAAGLGPANEGAAGPGL